MNDDQLDGLKQFIAASVSQSEERLRGEVNQGFRAVRQEIQEVRQEVADGFLVVGEAINELHEHNVAVDQRLTKLEQLRA